MGCAIIGVMLFHATDDYLWDLSYHFFSRFGRWGVELFLFVSGFGIYFALAKKRELAPFLQEAPHTYHAGSYHSRLYYLHGTSGGAGSA